MSVQLSEEEIAVSGSLFSISLFEEKLMKNFQLISNKLRKFEALMELEQRNKTLEKEFKFLSMKVDTILEKLPKEGFSLNRNDVRLISKDQFFQLLNSEDDRLTKSRYHSSILTEFSRYKQQLSRGTHGSSKDKEALLSKMDKKDNIKTSFTAGQILKESQKGNKQVTKDGKGVMSQNQLELVSSIAEGKVQNQAKQQNEGEKQFRTRLDDLTKIVEELRLGRGYASFLQKEAEKFERFEQFEQKSRQTTRKLKQKSIHLQGIKQQNVRGQVLKSGLYTQLQRMQLNKQEIARQELMHKKSYYSNPLNKDKEQRQQKIELKQTKERKKEKDEQSFRRTGSIKKLDRLDRRLKVDDFTDINGVLRQIELRIEGKVSHDIFMGFIKDIDEKLQLIRLSNDTASQVVDLKKTIFVIQSKLQSLIGYLQNLAQEDDALLVKKQWTCISCDKSIQKFQGRVGQHLNWESVSAKKMSPTKAGAFGQTGLLATKIRNLIEGNDTE